MKRIAVRVSAVAGGLVALLLAGTAGLAAAELRVGVLMPLTGKGAAYGQHQQPAIKMFLEDVEKAAKGVPFKLVTYDTRGENSEALAAGIKVALYTTIFGLFVAIPATLVGAHLQARVRRLVAAIAAVVSPAIDALAREPRAGGGGESDAA